MEIRQPVGGEHGWARHAVPAAKSILNATRGRNMHLSNMAGYRYCVFSIMLCGNIFLPELARASVIEHAT
jgi:hypothetical protein